MFVEMLNGTLIALSLIRRVSRAEIGVVQLYDARGDLLGRAYEGDFEGALSRTHSMIPAQPGTYVLEWYPAIGDHPDGVCRTPVLGWRFGGFGYLEPVSVESLPSEYGLLFPDGSVILPEDGRLETIEAFHKEMRERGMREREKRIATEKKRAEEKKIAEASHHPG